MIPMLLKKASVGMYSGCDYLLSLKILFVYFLALPSLLHPSILFNCFYTCMYRNPHALLTFMECACANLLISKDRCPNGKRPVQITSGGRKRVNELRPGGRMSPSNIVRWDAIHR